MVCWTERSGAQGPPRLLNPIEIIAESPLSAAIVVATVLVAVSHEVAIASRGRRAFQMARVLWGPYLILLVLFTIIAVSRLVVIFSA